MSEWQAPENEPDIFKDYGVLDLLTDYPYKDVFTSPRQSGLHVLFHDQIPRKIEEYRPGLYDQIGGRVDRNQIDMMANFMGGYDWVARHDNPESAIGGARHYQSRQYDERPADSLADFYENKAGIMAFDPNTGRVDDRTLIDMAEAYALERLGL